MVREFSSGGVVVRRMRGRWWIAAIEPQRHDESPGVVALPKGMIDHGESAAQTAIREVHEETGIRGELITKLDDIKYFFVRTWGDRQRVFKVVSFFLLRYVSGRIDDVSHAMREEVRRALWIPLDAAPQQLSYQGERQMAERAQQYLSEHPESEKTPHAS